VIHLKTPPNVCLSLGSYAQGIKLHKVDPHLITAPKKIYKDLADCCRQKVKGDR
jgi:hypothetical protein